MRNEQDKKLALWDHLRDFGQMNRELGRLFDPLLWPVNEEKSRMMADAVLAPACDVVETEKEYRMAVDLPGIPQENIKVELHDRELVIHAERKEIKKEDTKTEHLVERYQGTFRRSFRLPENADGEQIVAQYDHGVLNVTLPKTQVTKTRQIKVNDAKNIIKPSSTKLS